MKFEIPEDIVQQATKCTKNLRCISENNENICRVLCHMEHDICFIKCVDAEDCSYLEKHERTILCNCPVRNEIYLRYEV